MHAQLIILGSGTCQLKPGQAASSVLIETGAIRLVFDMGRGIAMRLAERGLRQDEIEHIYLSHFHADHISDLIPYLQAGAWSRCDGRSKNLQVYGPKGVEVQLARLLGLFGPDELTRPHYRVSVHEIRDGGFTLGAQRFEMHELPPAGNHGLRFELAGKQVAITGDSNFHPAEVEFVRGVDYAIIDSGHLSIPEIIALAVQAQPRTFICSHLYAELEQESLAAQAAQAGFKGVLLVACDGLEIPLV